MAIGIVDSVRVLMGTQIQTKLDSQASNGTIKLYTGTRPAKGAAVSAPANVNVATLVLGKPSFGNPTTPVMFLAAVTSDTNAANSGTVTWARWADGGGNFCMDMGVGAGQEITMDNYAVSAGGTVNVNSGGTITVGNA